MVVELIFFNLPVCGFVLDYFFFLLSLIFFKEGGRLPFILLIMGPGPVQRTDKKISYLIQMIQTDHQNSK